MDANTLNIVFGIIGTIGTILGVVGIVLTIRGTKKKEPVYAIESVNVISDYSSKYENLTVTYKGERVENFTVSKVLFFNKGAEAIRQNDINTSNHIRLEATVGTILDVRVLQANSASSDFKATLDKDNEMVMIDFDYLNQNQGAVMEVIHTGLSTADLRMIGDIKDVTSVKRLSEFYFVTNPKSSCLTTILLIVAAVLMIALAWQRRSFENPESLPRFFVATVAWILGGATMGFMGSAIGNRIGLSRRQKSAVPMGLDSFHRGGDEG